jgi:hypothetical protein
MPTQRFIRKPEDDKPDEHNPKWSEWGWLDTDRPIHTRSIVWTDRTVTS